jgi:Bax protein
MPKLVVYRNILFFLLGLFLLNLCIGFYGSMKNANSNKSTSINYVVQDKEIVKNSSKYGTVDYISQAREMIDIFKKYDFTIDSFIKDQSANLIIFSSLPKDFMDINSVSERKNLFINTLLPIAFIENLKILDDRKRILDWWSQSNGETYQREFWPSWLYNVSDKYDYEGSNIGELLMRVDIVPLSLALAQAAIESGWGTSRYLREGNALYGQYTFDKSLGLKPQDRDRGKDFYVRKFINLSDSTRSYLKNINTHNAYVKFRQERGTLRMNGDTLTGLSLSRFLDNYSERRSAYVADIKTIIETNNFMKFDKVEGLIN